MSRWRRAESELRHALGVDVVLAGDIATSARRAGMAAPECFRPPHPHLSLTHAGDVVVAAAIGTGDRSRVGGLGVDFEPGGREVTGRAARLFLGEQEQRRVERLPEQERSEARLVLWTIKEAAYKATPDNGGHTVAAYHVPAPGVTHFRDGLGFRHAVVRFAAGHLAIAILEREAIHVAV